MYLKAFQLFLQVVLEGPRLVLELAVVNNRHNIRRIRFWIIEKFGPPHVNTIIELTLGLELEPL